MMAKPREWASKVSKAIILLLTLVTLVAAETRVADSPSLADVLIAYNAAEDGDTVFVPAGGAYWTNTLIVEKNVTLQGAGTNSLIITSAVPSTVNNGAAILLSSSSPSYRQKIAGFTFTRDNDVTPVGNAQGVVTVTGTSLGYRVTSCVFTNIARMYGLRVQAAACGVTDHCRFYAGANGGAVIFWHSAWGGGQWGDESFSSPETMGGDAHYVEDCFLTSNNDLGITDVYGGARIVMRFNEIYNARVSTHGTGDGSGRNRGGRHLEFYRNRHGRPSTTSVNSLHWRSGLAMIFENEDVNGGGYTLHYYRSYSHSKRVFGKIGNAFDLMYTNDGEDTPGGAGDGVFYANNAGAGSANNRAVVPGAGWTPNQWKGYLLAVPNALACQGDEPEFTTPVHCPDFYSLILSNSADTIYVNENTQDPYKPKPIRVGDYFEIRRVLLALDMVGSGRTDVMTNKSSSPPPVFLNQHWTPAYLWSNTRAGQPMPIGADALFELNFHYMTDVSNGVIIGSLEDMAGTMGSFTNQAYWATNAVNWDTTTPELEGQLYVWTNGVWNLRYTPAQYPHWLVIGEELPDPPSAPASLAAVAVSSSQINLTWDASSVTNETGFVVERRIGDGAFASVASLGADVEAHSDTSLDGGTTFYYRVKAFNLGGASSYSNTNSATTLPASIPPPRGRRLPRFGFLR